MGEKQSMRTGKKSVKITSDDYMQKSPLLLLICNTIALQCHSHGPGSIMLAAVEISSPLKNGNPGN